MLLSYLWKSVHWGKIEGKEDELMFFIITCISDASANYLISALPQWEFVWIVMYLVSIVCFYTVFRAQQKCSFFSVGKVRLIPSSSETISYGLNKCLRCQWHGIQPLLLFWRQYNYYEVVPTWKELWYRGHALWGDTGAFFFICFLQRSEHLSPWYASSTGQGWIRHRPQTMGQLTRYWSLHNYWTN